MRRKLLTFEELRTLERKADDLRFSDRPCEAKAIYELAARLGSGLACYSLAGAYCQKVTVFPESFSKVFVKNGRRSLRFHNRALKCFRHHAQLGDHTSMFNLYNIHYFGHPGLTRLKNKEKLAEFWLHKAAQSGESIPVNELTLYLRGKNG